jgi:hypothetical protein
MTPRRKFDDLDGKFLKGWSSDIHSLR